jgi:hypothetical protein
MESNKYVLKTRQTLFPQKIEKTLVIRDLVIGKVNRALTQIDYPYCEIEIDDINDIYSTKKIKCIRLKTKKLTKNILRHFDISCFREIKAEHIDCDLDGLFYCNVNEVSPRYNYLAHNDFIENLKIIRYLVGNSDVLFEIFKKEYYLPVPARPVNFRQLHATDPNRIFAYARNYNILRIIFGFGGIPFAS